jgi:hypothetical protein
LIDQTALAWMKRLDIHQRLARATVDERAAWALKNRLIAGAGLDVRGRTSGRPTC